MQPTSGTAIAAGVLAILGGVTWLGWSVYPVGGLLFAIEYGHGGAIALTAVSLLLSLAITALLITGAVMVLAKKRAGRALVAVGCALVLLLCVIGIVGGLVGASFLGDLSGDAAAGVGVAAVIVGLLFGSPAVVTLALVLTRSTKEYLEFHADAAKAQVPPGTYGQLH